MRKTDSLSAVLMFLLPAGRALGGSAVEPGEQATASQSSIHEVLAEAQWIDLTHAFEGQTIYWPTESGFELQRGPAGLEEAGYYHAANRFSAEDTFTEEPAD